MLHCVVFNWRTMHQMAVLLSVGCLMLALTTTHCKSAILRNKRSPTDNSGSAGSSLASSALASEMLSANSEQGKSFDYGNDNARLYDLLQHAQQRPVHVQMDPYNFYPLPAYPARLSSDFDSDAFTDNFKPINGKRDDASDPRGQFRLRFGRSGVRLRYGRSDPPTLRFG